MPAERQNTFSRVAGAASRLGPLLDMSAKVQTGLKETWLSSLAVLDRRLRRLHEHGQLTSETARQTIRSVLQEWPETAFNHVRPMFSRLLSSGYLDGAALADVPIRKEFAEISVGGWVDQQVVALLLSLRDLTQDVIQGIDTSLLDDSNVEDLFALIADKATIVDGRTKLIVRTSLSNANILGHTAAWKQDPYREFYLYHWKARHGDSRTKDISLAFDRGSPYEFKDFRRVAEDLHTTSQRVWNRKTGRWDWQTSIFNCRCTVYRLPKPQKLLYEQGLISRSEYEEPDAL